jgi:O-antigen/teichoic acid export membrane protein
MPVAYSFADQALAAGGSFLANVILARTQSKEEYGMFALSYSFYMFLTSIHNSTILEPYTVYGSGRYRAHFSEYLRLMARSNAILGLVLTGSLLLICLALLWIAPQLVSRALWGLALTVGILLSGLFLRRVFYLQGQSSLAAGTSLVFFVTVVCGLWLTVRAHVLDGFSVFLVLALGWIMAGLSFGRKLSFGKPQQSFLELEPDYWREHWKYTRWVLATAFVYQLTTQGYYWLVGGFLSVKEVGDLRAMYLLVTPVEQGFVALTFLVLPALASRYAAKRMGDYLSLLRRYGLAILSVTGLFALAVRAVGKPLMHALYAGKFDGLAPILFIFALLPVFTGIGCMLSNALNAAEKPKLVFLAYLCSAVSTVLLGIPLVMRFGLRGAVYGMLVSGGTYAGALFVGFLFTVYNKMQAAGGGDVVASLSAGQRQ